jgi:hypothetical protein
VAGVEENEAEPTEAGVEENEAEPTVAGVEENEAEPTEAEAEDKAASAADGEEEEMTETCGRSAWSLLISVGSWTTGRAKKFLSSMASRLACGLQNFERVIASLPPTLSYISFCDNFMCMQSGKYTMSMKGTKQKLKRRAAKAMKCNPMGSPAAIGEMTTVGKKTSQHPSQSVNERALEEEKEFEEWFAEHQARHLAKLGVNSSLREEKWREYGSRCVDRWPKGGAKNFRDIVVSNKTPRMVMMYTDGVNLDSVDLDRVDTYPGLYRRDRMKQTALVSRGPRGHSRLKRTKTQHAVIQRKERRLKTIFTDLARGLKERRTRDIDDPGARLNRAQRTRWRRIESVGLRFKVIKTRECRKPDVKHNRAERARWWRELKMFTSRIWQDSAHLCRTHVQKGERVRLYRLRRAYDRYDGWSFVNIVEEEVRRKYVKTVVNSPTTEPEHSVKT